MLRNPLGGFLYFAILYFSSFFGVIFILGPSLPLLLLNPSWFRWFNDKAISWWIVLAPAMLELVFGVKVKITGDKPPRGDTSLIIMNHRCHFDWMFYWSVLHRYGNLQYLRIIMKDVLKGIPGIGWGMQQAMYIFLRRRWEQDEGYLDTILDYFRDLNYPIQLVIFPEGTNLDEKSRPGSDSFARKNNLPLYEYVLHPRVRGFVHCVEKLRNAPRRMDAIHDVTIGYDRNYCFTERDIICGDFPREMHFHIKRYPISEIPTGVEDLENWCQKRWAEKEERLKVFYKQESVGFGFCAEGEEITQDVSDKQESTVRSQMIASMVFFVAVIIVSVFVLYRFDYARWFFVALVAMYLLQAVIGFGMDRVQLLLHNQLSAQAKKTIKYFKCAEP